MSEEIEIRVMMHGPYQTVIQDQRGRLHLVDQFEFNSFRALEVVEQFYNFVRPMSPTLLLLE